MVVGFCYNILFFPRFAVLQFSFSVLCFFVQIICVSFSCLDSLHLCLIVTFLFVHLVCVFPSVNVISLWFFLLSPLFYHLFRTSYHLDLSYF